MDTGSGTNFYIHCNDAGNGSIRKKHNEKKCHPPCRAEKAAIHKSGKGKKTESQEQQKIGSSRQSHRKKGSPHNRKESRESGHHGKGYHQKGKSKDHPV